MIQYKKNWEESIQRFDAWFHAQKTERPLMNLLVSREESEFPDGFHLEEPFDDAEDKFLNTEKNIVRVKNYYNRCEPVCEAFPQFSMDLGAGSMALYLGSQPTFEFETLWFSHFVEDYNKSLPLRFDPENFWWKKHLEILKKQKELSKDTDIMVCIPDIIENIDIVSAIRDPQQCCFDIYDYPDELMCALNQISDMYMNYYDEMFNIVKTPDNVSAYTVFSIAGTGKTAKIQCDLGALLSPDAFDEFVIPGLKRQCDELDNTLFHLDGPECLVHVDSLMKISNLNALQWTPGVRNELGGSERWFDLYRKVRKADKGLWISLEYYTPKDAIEAADRIVRTIGPAGLYFHFPVMNRVMADELIIKAENEWKC